MSIKKLTISGLLVAVSILLPQVFHLIGGQGVGRVFLPMHLGIFLIGFIVGGRLGMIVGIFVPLLSFALSSMPMPPMLFFMMCELCVYGAISGSLRLEGALKSLKLAVYLKLLVAMVAGRIVSGLAMASAVWLFGLSINPVSAVIAAFITGLPGITLQLLLIPPIHILLKRGGLLFEPQTA